MNPGEYLKAAENAKILGFDTESTGLRVQDRTDKLTGCSLSFKGGPLYLNYYFPFFHKVGENLHVDYLSRIQTLISRHPLVVHNAKHDIAAGLTRGLDLRLSPMIYDPMIECHFVDEESYSKQLEYLVKNKLKEPEYKNETDVFGKIFGWDRIPSSLMAPRAAKDAEYHLRLHEYYWPQIETEELANLWPIEQEFIKLMAKIETNGVKVNISFCEEQIDIGYKRMQEIINELGFDPGKPTELAPFLLETLELPVLKVGKPSKSFPQGRPSFDKNVMAEYEEILNHRGDKTSQLVLEFRGWQKTVSSFYEALLKFLSTDGRIRPNFKLHVARTTRLSCEKPALQCIPRESNKPWNGKSKQAFEAEEGYVIIEFDYKQLEMRLETEYSEEASIREIFADPDRDLFSEMAVQIDLPRFATKTFKYATGYGAGSERIALTLGISKNRAEEIRNNYRAAYPGIYRATATAKRLAENRGYVRFWTGRRRHLTKYDSSKAFNAIMQGGAAEITKRAMLRIDAEVCKVYGNDCRMILQVHDSIWLEIKKELVNEIIPKVKTIMVDLPQFKTVFAVDAHQIGV